MVEVFFSGIQIIFSIVELQTHASVFTKSWAKTQPLFFVYTGWSPVQVTTALLEKMIEKLDDSAAKSPRVVEIPVCYGGELGPDLEYVAEYNHLTVDEVIDIHVSNQCLVYMIGFAPGFPYLGGMSERIATPRRPSPRAAIPAGSVGIAGLQTGVYPITTPGGWQLIGRTPLALFRPYDVTPSLLQAGDLIQFRSISPQKFEEYKEKSQ